MRKNEKITALYERLSRDDFGKDDDQQRESNSISNQKAMLEEFAARQGFTNIVHFTDDGISGTCFDRPGFLAMMKEVEAGNVEYLCIKDMSRMGRDYLKVGQIMEILRQRGVRLIAINDGVDSARGDDDFTPFRNIMNEYYARDTSRKIRSTFQSKGKSGKHLTGTVIYGYLWNEARDQWLVDPEAADVVKRIFAMTIDGYGPYQIASKLKSEKVLIPSAYLAQHGVLCAGGLQKLRHLVGAVGSGAVGGAAGGQSRQQTPRTKDKVGLPQRGQTLEGQALGLAGTHADECHVHLIISLQRFNTSEAVSPCSGGRRMTTSCAPAAEAAAAFSSKPPAAPPSFVTSQRIWNCSIMA